MKKVFEVELRGPLQKSKYDWLKRFFDGKGLAARTKNRILIDYSTCIEGEDIRKRNLDIRARITNKIPEMIIKVGKWKGGDVRKEISVLLQEGQFSNLVQAYAALGYKKGILCVRNSLIYVYDDVEFALVEVPGHSYFFEAEIAVSSEEETAAAKDKVGRVCRELGLTLFSDEEWFSYIELLNREANKLFDIDRDGEEYFAKEFGV